MLGGKHIDLKKIVLGAAFIHYHHSQHTHTCKICLNSDD
jgi:hypothetical protein